MFDLNVTLAFFGRVGRRCERVWLGVDEDWMIIMNLIGEWREISIDLRTGMMI